MPAYQGTRSPRTKEELVNKILSYDFNGDIRTLGEGVSLVRTKPHIVSLRFPDIDRAYELVVRIPREEKKRIRAKPKVDEWDQPAPTTRRNGAQH